jgi:hypothetical protein
MGVRDGISVMDLTFVGEFANKFAKIPLSLSQFFSVFSSVRTSDCNSSKSTKLIVIEFYIEKYY